MSPKSKVKSKKVVTEKKTTSIFKKIKSLPEKFVPEKYNVEQLYATSADGTLIPYFQVSNSDMEKNSMNH